MEPVCIVLLHSMSHFASRMWFPTTKRYFNSFASTGYMVVGSVALANWDPKYPNLLRNSLNVPSTANIYTALALTPPHILTDSMSESDYGATALRVHPTVYVPTSFVPKLLSGKLRPVEA